MKISFNSSNYINKTTMQITKAYSNSFCGNSPINEDVFISTTKKKKDPIESNKRKLDISDYKSLSEKEIEDFKSKYCDESEIRMATRDVNLAIKFKKSLDEKYGEGNYIFECIGTSPSTIGRVLEFMGVETHYLPISNIRKYQTAESICHNHIDKNKEGKAEYSKFLKSQGISKEEIEKSNKTYLFYDYTVSGTTLNYFKEILKNCFDIPVDNNNVEFRTLNEDFANLFYYTVDENGVFHNVGSKEKDDCYYFIRQELEQSRAALYGGIAHLGFFDLEHIADIQKDTTGENSKIFNFLVIDKLNEMGLLKENPANKNSL